jgi:hypothetical protein
MTTTTENFTDITKETFVKYYEAQMRGEYNMIMDAAKVMEKYNISKDDYLKIITNYKVYRAKFID